MKNTMTYAQALTIAIESIDDAAVIDRLRSLRETLAKRSQRSEDSKAKASAKRKEQTAAKRAETASIVVPILRKVIDRDMTAKEIFESAKEFLPQGFTAPKVQTYLLREMKDELVKTETKNKANTYRRV